MPLSSLSFVHYAVLLTDPDPVFRSLAVAGYWHSPLPPVGLFVLLWKVIRIERVLFPIVGLPLEECRGNFPIFKLDATDRLAIRTSTSFVSQCPHFTDKVFQLRNLTPLVVTLDYTVPWTWAETKSIPRARVKSTGYSVLVPRASPIMDGMIGRGKTREMIIGGKVPRSRDEHGSGYSVILTPYTGGTFGV